MGGITMGVMTLALSVFSIIPMALSLANRQELARVVIKLMNKYNGDEDNNDGPPDNMAFWGAVSQVITSGGRDDDAAGTAALSEKDQSRAESMEQVMLVFFIVCIVLLAVYLACSALLIYSAAKGKARWAMMPWIVCTFLFLLAYLGGVCLTIWIFEGRLEILLLLAFAIIETAIGFYLWLCIVSLFQVLGSNEWLHGNGSSDWEMKPRFSTNYNSVPQHD